MAIVKELFGHPLHSADGIDARKFALCPFMGKKCDGGGNRDMARLSFNSDASVRARFDPSILKEGSVSCAICSVGLVGRDWIICPRRLLNFSEGQVTAAHQNLLKTLCRLAGFEVGDQVAVWREVRITAKQEGKSFNYAIDYLLRKKLTDGYAAPIFVEIMTGSTSGGNKRNGTDIATAFSKALLADQGDVVQCPGVNIRQVWSRMAGQLIAKSEVANAWGGKAIWVMQDLLVSYMKENTGLDFEALRSTEANEVNIIASNGKHGDIGVVYAGPISGTINEASFADILRAPFIPDYEIFDAKFKRHPDGIFTAP
jgi:Restriction endonuclease NotI